MSSRNPFGWDLPPGVTNKMIDDAFGSPEPCHKCDGTGKTENMSDCCGALRDEDTGICFDCKDHSSAADCSDCDGTGINQQEKEQRENDE